jgi:hypothetical protein
MGKTFLCSPTVGDIQPLFGSTQRVSSPANLMNRKTKTVQLSTRTTNHDISYRAKRVAKWLNQGHSIVLEVNQRKAGDSVRDVLSDFTRTCGISALDIIITSDSEYKLIAKLTGGA